MAEVSMPNENTYSCWQKHRFQIDILILNGRSIDLKTKILIIVGLIYIQSKNTNSFF